MKSKLLAAAVIAGILLIWMSGVFRRPMETVLPNGFIVQDYAVVLSRDRSTVLSRDAEFLCFDDRYLYVTSMQVGKAKLFDSQSQRQVDKRSLPELRAPGGLFYGRKSCNGYYTAMLGPGLLHDDATLPFLPPCDSVNTDNPGLKNRAWLSRPCAFR